MTLDGPQLQLPHLPHSHSEPSKLCQLRAQYQQRQLAEKEQRLLQLYAEQRAQQERAFQRVGYAGYGNAYAAYGGSAGSSSSNTSQSSQSSLPCGKVRQLFEGRRQVPGRDRGQPLAPLERRARAPVLATRSNSNVNLSHSYHFGQQPPRQPRGHSLDRGLRSQGDWAARGQARRLDYASDSSDSGSESPPPDARYSRSFAHYPRFQEDVGLLSRLPNVGGPLYSQQFGMAPPGRLSASGSTTTTTRKTISTSNENAPPAAPRAARATSRLPGPARKTVGVPAPAPAAAAARKVPLRPSSGQRPAATVTNAVNVNVAKPASLSQTTTARSSASPATRTTPHTNGVTSKPSPVSKVPASPQRMAASRVAGAGGTGHAARGVVAAAASRKDQDDGLVPCPICSRRFAPDRVDKHQEICLRAGQKKRKTFDPVAARVKGTEAEKYVRRAKNAPEPKAMKNNNWRRKHEDFIQTIRAAKQVQSHIARGGKLSDLPPPPPSDYSDYVPCPHCGRKFNQTAADRHIPKCATMLHNKPKPGAAKPGNGRGAVSRR